MLKRENSIPSFLGYNTSAPYGNIGIVENKGFDATVEYNKRFIKTGRLLFAVILPIIRINGLKVNYRNNAMIG